MTTDLARTGTHDFDDAQRQIIRDSFASGASEQEFALLLEVARARRLNPLMRQIHFVQRWDSSKGRQVWSWQVSIDGLRAVAERTGLYAGQDEPEFVDGPDGSLMLCKVRVYRKDWPRPAVGVAYWSEYVQTMRDKATGKDRPAALWAKMPHVMLAKCAESLALRKAFPEDTSGLYTTEEMGQADNGMPPADVMPPPSSLPAPARPMVDLAVSLTAIEEAATCEAVVVAYRTAHDALRRVVSLDAPEAAEPLASLLAAAVERMHAIGLPLPDSRARQVVADGDLAALADELLTLRAGKGADALVGWWLAHSPAFHSGIVKIAQELAGRLWAGITATATPQDVAAVGKRWRAALAAPPAPLPAEEHGLVVALREHLASKPDGAAPGTKEHTSQLSAVAASYLKRLPDLADAGREDDALAVVRAELAARGCLDADALLAGVAARRKGAAKE